MTYDSAKYGISYRNCFLIPIWSMHDKDLARVVRKSYRTVIRTLQIRWVLKDHFKIALYRTVPIRTIPYCTWCTSIVRYGTVPYWNQNQYVIFARIMAKQLSSVRCGTVCGCALYRTGQTARANIFCGDSRSQARAQFRYQIILQVGDMILPIIG